MIRIGIIGATGYTALELIKILQRHPSVEITRITTRDSIGKPIGEVHSGLRHLGLKFSGFDVEDFKANVDFAFSCLPHAASAPIVEQLLEAGLKVVDFSADYRLDDVESFETHYQVKHTAPDRLGSVPYGIPELFRDQIREAPLVANPGCFPSSVVIPLAPLWRAGVVQKEQIIADSKTGISGAGRKANLKFHLPECNESVAAYAVGTHRHGPEMSQILGRIDGGSSNVIFTPHLIPMDRGILSTIYLQPNGKSVGEIMALLQSSYENEPFIRLTDSLPSTKDVSGTNFCDISVRESGGLIVVLSAIDNLIKGASGAAVQNFNLMSGFSETTALI